MIGGEERKKEDENATKCDKNATMRGREKVKRKKEDEEQNERK